MADKQLTVAELMARAQQENPDAQPRRRRRRSLDEGGVSVAELTGSLKAVDARPAEVKHSSVPIDAEPAKTTKTVKPAEPSQQEKTEKQEKPEQSDKPKQQVKPKTATNGTAKVESPAPAQTEKTAAPAQKSTKIERTPQPVKPAPKPAAEPTPKPATTSVPKPEPVKAQSQPTPARPEPRPQDETLTRGSFKAVAPQPSKTEQTGPISRVVSLEDRPATDSKAPGGKGVGEGSDVDKPALRESDADTATTQESPVVRDEHLPEQPVYRAEDADQVEVDNSVNPIMLVLLVFAGLVVGVLMFLGFQYLWASLNPFLAGVLALAVTGGVVMLVRAMKTGRDALTMTLAALAGAAMTFGPALVTTV
ncbi:hypothetical protein [Corynebacterium urinipleomorphum]|uniref:hypothetical protein n=1 Tax=Corynebacterium urinipleomorphum TaxID=1852380 RepID=UPI000B35B677|nr:hypothetical protein [Corynebacterium urinipleomorphum]